MCRYSAAPEKAARTWTECVNRHLYADRTSIRVMSQSLQVCEAAAVSGVINANNIKIDCVRSFPAALVNFRRAVL